MKKQIIALATTALFGASYAVAQVDLSDLSVSTSMAFESEYIFRGKQKTDEAFQPSVELGMGGLYGGVWTSQPADDDGASNQDSEVDLYLGYGMDLTDMVSLDAGFTYYLYPEQEGETSLPGGLTGVDRSRELYVGVAADVMLHPAAYLYYDLDLEQIVIEFSGGYSFDLSDFVSGSSLDLTGYVGFIETDDFSAGQISNPILNSITNGYTYWGLSADYTYSFTDAASMSVGVRYAENNDNGGPGTNPVLDGTGYSVPLDRQDHLWWGASFSAGF